MNGNVWCKRIFSSLLVELICLNMAGCTLSTGKTELLAEIAPVKYGSDAIVTIVSDDGDYQTGVFFDELSSKYGYRVTVAGIVEWVEPYLEEWKEIELKGGVELISHSYSHVYMGEESEISSDELEHQITDSITFYKENFVTDQIAFIPPGNTMCVDGYQLLEQNGIVAVRRGNRGYNLLAPEDGYGMAQWYNLCTFGIMDVQTTEERNAWIDEAVEEKAWIIEMWHNISEDGARGGYQEISFEKADEHMGYIAQMVHQEKIWAASLTEASKYLLEKENAAVSATYSNSKIKVKLRCDKKAVPEEVYNEPLTVIILLPETTGNVLYQERKKDDRIRIREENGESYLEFEMLPNSEVTINLAEEGIQFAE
ncbi:MAG: polysaccharide deacetylase family protein [Lachnospiraceae bacterium]